MAVNILGESLCILNTQNILSYNIMIQVEWNVLCVGYENIFCRPYWEYFPKRPSCIA